MNFHKRGMNKEVRVLTRAKWRICRKYPFISSWLTGACGGGEPKSVHVCSEASAYHTWPLPSTLANERWPLGAICCELLQSQQRCASFPDRNTGTHLFEDIQCPREDATSSKRWTQSLIYSRRLSRFSELTNTNDVCFSSQIFPCFVDGAAGEFNLCGIRAAELNWDENIAHSSWFDYKWPEAKLVGEPVQSHDFHILTDLWN